MGNTQFYDFINLLNSFFFSIEEKNGNLKSKLTFFSQEGGSWPGNNYKTIYGHTDDYIPVTTIKLLRHSRI